MLIVLVFSSLYSFWFGIVAGFATVFTCVYLMFWYLFCCVIML